MIRIVFLFCCLLSFANFGIAQELSPADQRKRDAIVKELTLNEQQVVLLDSLYTQCAVKLEEIDLRLKEVSRSDSLSEDQVLVRTSVMQQERKDLREIRDLETKAFLSTEQQALFDEKIAPQKPQVLHFGIHNRADCNVCNQ